LAALEGLEIWEGFSERIGTEEVRDGEEEIVKGDFRTGTLACALSWGRSNSILFSWENSVPPQKKLRTKQKQQEEYWEKRIIHSSERTIKTKNTLRLWKSA
jgi:hypothetical protein